MEQVLLKMLLPPARMLHDLVVVIPMGVVRGIVFGILAVLAVWVLRMKPQIPEKSDASTPSLWDDLRIFALIVLALQAMLYIFF